MLEFLQYEFKNKMADKKWLKTEVSKWVKEGLVNASQGQGILAKYGLAKAPSSVHKPNEKHTQNTAITAISIIGSILIGLGVIVFVGSNWQEIPAWGKLILLLVATFGSYYAGWEFRYNRPHHKGTGYALLLLGSLVAGATIFLIAQAYHVQADEHSLLLLWFLAIFPLSYGFNMRTNLFLSLIVLTTWLGLYIESISGFSGDNFFGIFPYLGLSLYGVGYLHEKTKFENFKTTYQGFGAIMVFIFLYSIIVSELRVLDDIVANHWLAYLLMGTSLLTAIGIAYRAGQNTANKFEIAWYIVALVGVFGAWALASGGGFEFGDYRRYGQALENNLFIFNGYNLLFLGLTVLTVFMGYHKKVGAFINIGILFFVLHVGYFYFTTVFEYLPKSLALVLGGILLLLGGYYLEKKRREVMQEIEK